MAAKEQGKPVQRAGQQQETEGGDSQVDAERERRSLQHKPDQVRDGQDHGQEQRDEAEHDLEKRAQAKHDKDEHDKAGGRETGRRGRDGGQDEEKSEAERVREVEQADKDFPSSWAPTQGTKD